MFCNTEEMKFRRGQMKWKDGCNSVQAFIGDVVHARLDLGHTDHPVRCRHRPPDPERVCEMRASEKQPDFVRGWNKSSS